MSRNNSNGNKQTQMILSFVFISIPFSEETVLPRLCRGEIEHVHCIWVMSYFACVELRTSDNSEVFLHSLGL